MTGGAPPLSPTHTDLVRSCPVTVQHCGEGATSPQSQGLSVALDGCGQLLGLEGGIA